MIFKLCYLITSDAEDQIDVNQIQHNKYKFGSNTFSATLQRIMIYILPSILFKPEHFSEGLV